MATSVCWAPNRAKAQTSGETVKANLDEIEQAMMREMEKTHQNGRPE